MKFKSDSQRKAVFAHMNKFAEGMSIRDDLYNPFQPLPQSFLPVIETPKVELPKFTELVAQPQSIMPTFELPKVKYEYTSPFVQTRSPQSIKVEPQKVATTVMQRPLFTEISKQPMSIDEKSISPFVQLPSQAIKMVPEEIIPGVQPIDIATAGLIPQDFLVALGLKKKPEITGSLIDMTNAQLRAKEIEQIKVTDPRMYDEVMQQVKKRGEDMKMSLTPEAENDLFMFYLQKGRAPTPFEEQTFIGGVDISKPKTEMAPALITWKVGEPSPFDTTPSAPTIPAPPTAPPEPVIPISDGYSKWLLPAAGLAGAYFLTRGMGDSRHVRRVYPDEEEERRRR